MKLTLATHCDFLSTTGPINQTLPKGEKSNMKKIILTIIITLIASAAIANTFEEKFFPDEFEGSTKKSFVGFKNYAKGEFSNSATTNSSLDIYFYTTRKTTTFQMFEYAGNHPATTSSIRKYNLLLQYGHDKKRTSIPIKHSGSFFVVEGNPLKLHNILKNSKKGEKISFLLSSDDYITKYRFSIKDSSGYSKAYKDHKTTGILINNHKISDYFK